MRLPGAVLGLLISSFIFFIFYVIGAIMLSEAYTALSSAGTGLGGTYQYELSSITTAFGVICVLLFVIGIIVLFFFEVTAEEPETYYKYRRGGR